MTACQKQLEAEIERARLTAADTEALHQQHISKLKAEHKVVVCVNMRVELIHATGRMWSFGT